MPAPVLAMTMSRDTCFGGDALHNRRTVSRFGCGPSALGTQHAQRMAARRAVGKAADTAGTSPRLRDLSPGKVRAGRTLSTSPRSHSLSPKRKEGSSPTESRRSTLPLFSDAGRLPSFAGATAAGGASAARRGKVVHVCELAGSKRKDAADYVGWDGVEGIRKHSVVIPPHVKSMAAVYGIASRTIGWTKKDGKRVQTLMTLTGEVVTDPAMIVDGDLLMASHAQECARSSPDAAKATGRRVSGAAAAPVTVRIVPPNSTAFTPALIPVTLHPHARCDIVSLCNAIANALPGSPRNVSGLRDLSGAMVTDPSSVVDDSIFTVLATAHTRNVALAPLSLPITVGVLPNAGKAGAKVEALSIPSAARMSVGAWQRHVGGRAFWMSGLEVKEPNHVRDGDLLVVVKDAGEAMEAPELTAGVAWSPLPESAPVRLRAALTVTLEAAEGNPVGAAGATAVLPAWASRSDILHLLARAAGLTDDSIAVYTPAGQRLLAGSDIDVDNVTPVVVLPSSAPAPFRTRVPSNPRRLSILLPERAG